MAALSPVTLAAWLSVCLPAAASASPNPTGPNPLAKHPPQRITARRMPPDYANVRPGTKVPPSWVTSRSFTDSTHGFGLAEIGGKRGGGTYPARTTNGGATWRTDGPAFVNASADGAEGVEYTGVVGDRTQYAYGASVVDVTTNAGRTWWQAFLGEQLLAVTFQNNRLIAIVQQQTTHQGLKAVTQVYVSKDGGRHWRYNNQLGAL